MMRRYRMLFVTVLAVLFGFAADLLAAGPTKDQAASLVKFELLEEQGVEFASAPAETPGTFVGQESCLLDSLPDFPVLLIPESNTDYVGMYDPMTGDFLGVLIPGHPQFQTPICAILGPDGNVYVSDQVADAVFVFDRQGNFLYTYADASDGLNNIRGIAFRGDHLFVTSGNRYTAEFAGPHNRLPDFINDGSDPFDIFFLEDGSALLADIYGTSDNVRLYDANGTFVRQLFSVSFPEQIQSDSMTPGEFLNASFSSHIVTDFERSGTIVQTTSWNSGRGCYRLGNGNLLVTSSNGVFEIQPGTGAILSQKNTGSGRFIELVPGRQVKVDNQSSVVPRQLMLSIYPNPFNARTKILYSVSESGPVSIDVVDILGRHVETLVRLNQQPGEYEISWQPLNLPSGLYFCQARAGSHAQTVRMMLLK